MKTYFRNKIEKIHRAIDSHPGSSFLAAYVLVTGSALGGVFYLQHELSKYAGKQLSAYVENVDGKKGFSREDILDFAKHAQFDSAQTAEALKEIPVDSLRDFSQYFNSFCWSKYNLPSEPNNNANTCGTVALDFYSGITKRKEDDKKKADSLRIAKNNERDLQARIEERLEQVIVFPGRMDEYERRVGYSVRSIPIPGNDQAVWVSIGREDNAKTIILEPDNIRRYLFYNNIEAVVDANQLPVGDMVDTRLRKGLPVARLKVQ